MNKKNNSVYGNFNSGSNSNIKKKTKNGSKHNIILNTSGANTSLGAISGPLAQLAVQLPCKQ